MLLASNLHLSLFGEWLDCWWAKDAADFVGEEKEGEGGEESKQVDAHRQGDSGLAVEMGLSGEDEETEGGHDYFHHHLHHLHYHYQLPPAYYPLHQVLNIFSRLLLGFHLFFYRLLRIFLLRMFLILKLHLFGFSIAPHYHLLVDLGDSGDLAIIFAGVMSRVYLLQGR